MRKGIRMRLWNWIYPEKCVFCGALLRASEKGGCCPACRKTLPYVREPVCKRCGKPITDAREGFCMDCMVFRTKPSALAGSVAVWEYRENTRAAMVAFKYGGCTDHVGFFADEILRSYGMTIRSWDAEVLVPVPIHRRREWFRGYNQAGLLADALGERLSIPVFPVLKRIRHTEPLKKLTPEERKKNLRHAFAVRENAYTVKDSAILVDDIYTTGATLEVCAGLLREAGFAQVHAVCLCIGTGY